MKFSSIIFALCLPYCFAESKTSRFVLNNHNADVKNIVKLAEELGATTLVSYLKAAGLESTLTRTGPFTVFGPTNAAFEALPADVKQKLTTDTELLKKVLLFHVTSGQAYSTQLSNNLIVQSLEPSLSIRVNIYGNDSKKVVTADGAIVQLADQNATNGVIHVIDKVMYPLPSEDILNSLVPYKELSTLLFAVVQGQLTGRAPGIGSFTLFAPTNAAFDKLPPGAFSDLLSNQTALVDVLKYHVVDACIYSAGFTSRTAQTLEGRSVEIKVSSGGVMVNNAKVVMTDIPMANGVIHEIDHVLLPP